MVDFSVIIPHYNNLELLPKAINSIPVDSRSEVIVVDNSPVPIQKNEIKNVNREFYLLYSSSAKGAGAARNVALEKAVGKYLLFLDADDYFTPYAFDTFKLFIDSDFDIVYFNATSIKLSNGQVSNRHLTIDDKIKKFLLTNNEDFLRYNFLNPVCKLIKRELVEFNNIKFQEVPASNDVMFSMWTGHNANRITAVNEAVYVITEGEVGSSLVKTKSLKNQKSRFYVLIDRIKFLSSINRDDMQPRVVSYIFNALKDFGFVEAMKWVIYAQKNGVNPFKY